MNSKRVRAAALAALAAALVVAGGRPGLARPAGSAAEVDARARAAGNRREAAVALGTTLFAVVRPAQVMKVRIDGAGRHEVAGLVLSGVKFHGPLDRETFTAEVIDLVGLAFAASDVEEVDCWATVPLPPEAHVVVSGDMAQPTTRTVFAVTVRRSERATFARRLQRGIDVYWNPAFAARLGRGAGPGGSTSGS